MQFQGARQTASSTARNSYMYCTAVRSILLMLCGARRIVYGGEPPGTALNFLLAHPDLSTLADDAPRSSRVCAAEQFITVADFLIFVFRKDTQQLRTREQLSLEAISN